MFALARRVIQTKDGRVFSDSTDSFHERHDYVLYTGGWAGSWRIYRETIQNDKCILSRKLYLIFSCLAISALFFTTCLFCQFNL